MSSFTIFKINLKVWLNLDCKEVWTSLKSQIIEVSNSPTTILYRVWQYRDIKRLDWDEFECHSNDIE